MTSLRPPCRRAHRGFLTRWTENPPPLGAESVFPAITRAQREHEHFTMNWESSTAHPQTPREPIAIVGIGCRLPGGITDPTGCGRRCSRAATASSTSRQPLGSAEIPRPTGRAPGRSYVQKAGMLTEDPKHSTTLSSGSRPGRRRSSIRSSVCSCSAAGRRSRTPASPEPPCRGADGSLHRRLHDGPSDP
jgi:hypothetical protein